MKAVVKTNEQSDMITKAITYEGASYKFKEGDKERQLEKAEILG